MPRIIPTLSLLFALFLATSMSACAGTGKADTDSDSSRHVDMAGYESVPMPEIPSSLTNPEDRADYLLRHFWDALDFKSVKLPKDSVLLEQSFSNFASVLPLVNADVKESAVKILMVHASQNRIAYDFMADIAEKYLWEADSPFYSEESFLPFVKYYIANDASRRDVAMAREEEIAMNAPGSVAPDFEVKDTDGAPTTLYGALGQAPVIIMFYQPDCDHCHEAMDMLGKDARFMKGIEDGEFSFLPVYIGRDKAMWKSHASTLPKSWHVMIDEDETIDNDNLYMIKATPSFYVIGRDRRIVLKDASLQSFLSFF